MLNKDIHDEIEIMKRYSTHNKNKAFYIRNELNETSNVYERDGKKFKTVWIVGEVHRERICIDTDSHDMDNLNRITEGYFNELGRWEVYKSLHGFHLISVNHCTKDNRKLALGKIMMPGMTYDDINGYEYDLSKTFESMKVSIELSRGELQNRAEILSKTIIQKGLFKGHGNIDVLYSANSFLRNRCVLRVSRKAQDEKYESMGVLPCAP